MSKNTKLSRFSPILWGGAPASDRCAGGGTRGVMGRQVGSSDLSGGVLGSISESGRSAIPPDKPFPWTCANRVCGGSFMRLPYHSEYCPKCQKHLKAGRGDLLDPVMYARCQAIIEQERAGEAVPEERVDPAARDKASGAAAWRALLGLPPLKSDFDVDAAEDFEGLNKVLGVVLTSHKKHGTGRKGR